jgi:hypothetical protein
MFKVTLIPAVVSPTIVRSEVLRKRLGSLRSGSSRAGEFSSPRQASNTETLRAVARYWPASCAFLLIACKPQNWPSRIKHLRRKLVVLGIATYGPARRSVTSRKQGTPLFSCLFKSRSGRGKRSSSSKRRISCASWRSVFCLRTRFVRISAASPIHNSNCNSATSRSNQRACPLASMPIGFHVVPHL